MPALTKSQLVGALTALGEMPPKSWNMPELKLRLLELQGDLLNEDKPKKSRTSHRAMVIELNSAKKENKERLRQHVGQNLKVPLAGNETINQLMHKAIYDQSEPSPLDPVGFGVHAAKTYEEIFLEEKSYMAWILATAQEDPHGCTPRLLRLAGWRHQKAQQNMNHTAQGATYGKKMPMVPMGTTIGAGKTSVATAPQPSVSSDQMLTMMQQLMNHVNQLSEEVQNIKEERPHKKGKTVSEATSGSFELMQPWMIPFQLWQNSTSAVCQVPGLNRRENVHSKRLPSVLGRFLDTRSERLLPDTLQSLVLNDRTVLLEIACGQESIISKTMHDVTGSEKSAMRLSCGIIMTWAPMMGRDLSLTKSMFTNRLMCGYPWNVVHTLWCKTSTKGPLNKKRNSSENDVKCWNSMLGGPLCLVIYCIQQGIHATWKWSQSCQAWRLHGETFDGKIHGLFCCHSWLPG